MIAHGIDTTIVEIDPIVYDFAVKYFGLPSNHTAAIEDAVAYTERVALDQAQSFDYIIHDVFTGGAEPIPLFTLEFLQSLSTLLKPNGVIAIVGLSVFWHFGGLWTDCYTELCSGFHTAATEHRDAHHPERLPVLPDLPRVPRPLGGESGGRRPRL